MKMTNGGGFDKSRLEQSRLESFCLIISIFICVVIAGLFALSYPAGSFKHNEIALAGRINPNNASAASLLRLPGVGMTRAEAIVAYRSDFDATDGRRAFENYKDLEKVRGIGPKTAQKICEWLQFEQE
jgi:competence ComEA-like helix-hairpin-helix protein